MKNTGVNRDKSLFFHSSDCGSDVWAASLERCCTSALLVLLSVRATDNDDDIDEKTFEFCSCFSHLFFEDSGERLTVTCVLRGCFACLVGEGRGESSVFIIWPNTR
jgi:hypothetical protein